MIIKDHVCGMEINPMGAAVSRKHAGQTFHFCSEYGFNARWACGVAS
jgi:YHS domain-containing protein